MGVKIPSRCNKHGTCIILRRLYVGGGTEQVYLSCGCTLPLSWLARKERELVQHHFAKPVRLSIYKRLAIASAKHAQHRLARWRLPVFSRGEEDVFLGIWSILGLTFALYQVYFGSWS
jgi:hypothetical protein